MGTGRWPGKSPLNHYHLVIWVDARERVCSAVLDCRSVNRGWGTNVSLDNYGSASLSAGRGDGTGRLAAALAMVRAQALPYLPAHAAIGHLADGQAALTIEFAAPSPPGPLTPVLEADLQPAPARDRESLVRPAGEGPIR